MVDLTQTICPSILLFLSACLAVCVCQSFLLAPVVDCVTCLCLSVQFSFLLTPVLVCLCLPVHLSFLFTPVVDRCIYLSVYSHLWLTGVFSSLFVCYHLGVTPVVDHFFVGFTLTVCLSVILLTPLVTILYFCLSFYSHLLLTIVFCLCVCLLFLFTPVVNCFTGGISRDSGPWIPGHTLHAHALELQHTPPQKVTTNHKALYIEIIKNNCTD